METLGNFDYNQDNAIPFIQNEIKNYLKCDDVLSEYITVLLRNNKSKQEIINDVSEFVISTEQIESFIQWLWNFIPSYFESRNNNNNTKKSLPNKPNSRMFLNAVKQASDDTRSRTESMDLESSLDSMIPDSSNRKNYTSNNKKRINNNNNNNNNNHHKSNQTNFTITMDGLNDFYSKNSATGGSQNTTPNRKRKSREEDEEEAFQRLKHSNSNDDDDVQLEDDDDESQPTVKKTKKKERCQFWPSCKNGDGCEYHHPTIQCVLFPKCTYGNSCLFIHPSIPCKFGATCKNMECQFNHPQRMMPTQMMSSPTEVPCKHGFACPNKLKSCSYGHPAVACKFADKCQNKFCMYAHAKPCMYGSACVTPGCYFAHHLTEQQTTLPPCRFGKDCTNAQCKFQHSDREQTSTEDPNSEMMLSSTLPSTPPTDEMSIGDSNGTVPTTMESSI